MENSPQFPLLGKLLDVSCLWKSPKSEENGLMDSSGYGISVATAAFGES
jgi:hypothetical protein